MVTGASSGIGRAIAWELAAAGADVFVHARSNRDGAEETAARVESLGRNSIVHLCDLAEPAAREQLLSAVNAWRPDINIWVNNAGADVLTGEAAEQTFQEKLSLLWNVDVLATIELSRQIGNQMQQRRTPGAVILNMGWDQADTGMAGDSGEMFSAVKGAVMAFTKSLAHSLAPHVRVNCLAPGWIKTAWGKRTPIIGNRGRNRKACSPAGARPMTSPAPRVLGQRRRSVHHGTNRAHQRRATATRDQVRG